MWAVVFHSSPFSLQPFRYWWSFGTYDTSQMTPNDGWNSKKVQRSKGDQWDSSCNWALDPSHLPKVYCCIPRRAAGTWFLAFGAICDSPNFDVQGWCWFLLCHGWRCISHGSNWLFAIDSFYRFDLNLEVFLVWWLRRRRDDFRSRRSFCFRHILRFDLYCDIATQVPLPEWSGMRWCFGRSTHCPQRGSASLPQHRDEDLQLSEHPCPAGSGAFSGWC